MTKSPHQVLQVQQHDKLSQEAEEGAGRKSLVISWYQKCRATISTSPPTVVISKRLPGEHDLQTSLWVAQCWTVVSRPTLVPRYDREDSYCEEK